MPQVCVAVVLICITFALRGCGEREPITLVLSSDV